MSLLSMKHKKRKQRMRHGLLKRGRIETDVLRQYSYLGNYDVCPNQDTIASVYEQGGRVYVETASMFETADLQLQDMDTSRQYNDLYDNGRYCDIDEAMRLTGFKLLSH
jgi:hypothetical protein